jgi:hypothetical protein
MMNCGDSIVLNVAGWDPVTIRCERESGHPGPHHGGRLTWMRTPLLKADA